MTWRKRNRELKKQAAVSLNKKRSIPQRDEKNTKLAERGSNQKLIQSKY